MKKRVALLIIVALVFSFVNVASATEIIGTSHHSANLFENQHKLYSAATMEDSFVDNQVVLTLFPEYNDYCYTNADYADVGCVTVEEILSATTDDRPSRVLLLTLNLESKANVISAIKLLEGRPEVYCAEPNYLCTIDNSPDDSLYEDGDQWAIDKIDLPAAWSTTTGSSSVKVGIIDSGIDGTHPDLINRINEDLSYCFSSDYSDPLEDIMGHGTHVAGIIGAEGNNSIGVVGVCWNVQLVSLRVDRPDGNFGVSYTIQAIEYAEQNDIPILNYSAAGTVYSTAVYTAIQNYSGLFVCAASNENLDNDTNAIYPANYNLDNIISVGASTQNDQKRSSSNYGSVNVDIFAPGQKIMSTIPGGQYDTKGGTSMASPYVAGVAALLLSAYPNMTPIQIKNAILSHAEIVYDDSGNSVFGSLCLSGGRLNANMALNGHEFDVYFHNGSKHKYVCSTCGYTYYESHHWNSLRSRCYLCGYVSDGHIVAPIIYLEDCP